MYVFATVGVRVIAHYCGGELEKVSLFTKPTSCCGEEESDMSDCCKNDTKHVSLQSDFTFFKLISHCKATETNLFLVKPTYLCSALIAFPQTVFSIQDKAHPPNRVQDDIVSFSVIRI